ncbi:hypothetical protein RN001_001676 [Aquatica leii]|uniref:Uncharacterized protein n=1 Tax=Aquatica leii TaxID=1421715 RepID=A0AAN7SSP3_9COLE|nr:hypothetical protein RN001_001676 [Aquatica leii]
MVTMALRVLGKLQEWGLGTKTKTPGSVASKYYPTVRFNPMKKALFDPRATNYERTINLNDFICLKINN